LLQVRAMSFCGCASTNLKVLLCEDLIESDYLSSFHEEQELIILEDLMRITQGIVRQSLASTIAICRCKWMVSR
jgi:hypothetical protein